MRRLTILGVSLLVLASASSAVAQVATTGTIQIILEDAQGGRLPGVTVTATAVDVVTTRTAVSDAQGVATLEALAPSEKYVIKATLTGFRELTQEDVLARSGQTTTLRLPMSLSTVSELITVTATPAQVVDVTRAIAGTDITLQLTESLPTGRSYQSYLQLVPGVLPDSTISGGNPSSRSGMNWKDASTVSDNVGASTDNRYYFEGINVTDPVTGTFGANLNTEIIQEQKVITGGIPAEYVGAAGLISTVITKSGSNRYSGSANYFFQNNNLVAENKNLPGKTFSSADTAFTIGGPLRRDNLWGFGSFRYTNLTEDVSAQDTRLLLREVDTTQKQGFAKITWAPSSNDLLSFMFLNDPYKRSGSPNASLPNSRDVARIQGGNNFSVTYNRVWSRLLIDGAFNSHDGEITDEAVNRSTPRNTIAYQRTDVRTIADEQRGGYGQDVPEFRPTTQARGSAQYQWGDHRFKGGLEWAQHENSRNLLYLPDTNRAQYASIYQAYPGTTAASIASTTLWTLRNFNVTNASDVNGFISTVNGLPNRAAFYSLYDTDGNGTITSTELGSSLLFSSTAGNSEGQINYYRIFESALGSQDQKVRGLSFYGQDEIQLNRWTVNAGLRAERHTHFATTGESIFTFPWTFAPRLSAVFDVIGDGSQKLAAFYGRYHDPIRMDMSSFAGSLSGYVREEQVFANNQWVTYRRRGFPAFDAFFAPSTKTPYTDEFQLQYEADLGHNISGSATYYRRQTREIFEDFDPTIYTIPEAYAGVDGVAGNINAPNSLFLGWDYFGLDPNNPPVANFFLGTMTGGERNYNGLELVVRKRYSDRWQGLASYNYLDATGNTVSDGNADFAGDVFWLDPRSPGLTGTVPGTIHHIFKMGGSYETPWGVEFGGSYSWNSGTIVNRTQLLQDRRLPAQVAVPFAFGGIVENWVDPTAIGAVQNPSNGSANMRIRYVRPFNNVTGEFFVDIFNLFNQQTAVRNQDLAAGQGATPFGDPIAWLGPRRSFLGARIRF